MTAKVKKKLLDKEIPWEQVPERDVPLYLEAEAAEWAEWQKQKCEDSLIRRNPTGDEDS